MTGSVELRVNKGNANHHLWNNRGTWWCHITIRKHDSTTERMRFSLKTKDVGQARTRRDRIFSEVSGQYLVIS